MSKFNLLIDKQTAAPNYDLSTESIIAVLTAWDQKYGLTILNADVDSVTISFEKLPKNCTFLVNEIYDFCPDIIDQGLADFEELLIVTEEFDPEEAYQMRRIAEGVDFEEEDYPLHLLKNMLVIDKSLTLWWD